MSHFTPETIERVRDAADIVEIVSAYTDLRRQGERFVGLCPFHDERTPSFSVKPRDRLLLLLRLRGGRRRDPLRPGEGGARVPRRGRGARPSATGSRSTRERRTRRPRSARRRRGRLGEALERVAAFYEALPLGRAPRPRKAREYLVGARAQRGESARLRRRLRAERLGLGARPRPAGRLQRRRAARRRARSRGPEGRHTTTVFRSRITFPVRDERGRVVGFGARGDGRRRSRST